ncbi:MAG: hypothetical protein ACFFCQ_17160 [Promethearchaeota archaeon]
MQIPSNVYNRELASTVSDYEKFSVVFSLVLIVVTMTFKAEDFFREKKNWEREDWIKKND